jgi:beta-phosphoglucomutase family hydrolase
MSSSGLPPSPQTIDARARRASFIVVGALGLPARIRACLFDLDGVLTQTASVHAAAWKEMFDAFLTKQAAQSDRPFVAFDEVADYDTYVDGRGRVDGTRAFLRSRNIDLALGEVGERAGVDTIRGLSNAKNAILVRRIRRDGVEPYPGSVRYLHAVRSAGLRTAVVSSSANCAEILAAAGIADLFQTRVDGVAVAERHLRGKPAPDAYLAAAAELRVTPQDSAVFEDALSGVAAGRAGGFGYVVGVDRVGQADALRARGADIVVTDLGEFLDPP